MCGRGPVRGRDASASFLSVRGRTQTQLHVQLRTRTRTRTRLTELLNYTYAMNDNKTVIFEFLVIVSTWRETSLICLLLLIFCTGDVN